MAFSPGLLGIVVLRTFFQVLELEQGLPIAPMDGLEQVGGLAIYDIDDFWEDSSSSGSNYETSSDDEAEVEFWRLITDEGLSVPDASAVVSALRRRRSALRRRRSE